MGGSEIVHFPFTVPILILASKVARWSAKRRWDQP